MEKDINLEKQLLNINTPFFLLDESIISDELCLLKTSCEKYWNNYDIAYSVKTNSFPPLINYLRNNSIKVEVVSSDEYNLAKVCGYESGDIICNGPIKSEEWINEILSNKLVLNIDSKKELDFVCNYAESYADNLIGVGLRVNFNLGEHFPDEVRYKKDGGRFGFCYENNELKTAIAKLKKHTNIYIEGFHLHINSVNRKPEVYRLFVKIFTKIVAENKLHDEIKYIDIGGGFWGGLPTKPGWEDYLGNISDELKNNNFSPDKLKLILEPGASLIAGCFSYYTKVIDVKKTSLQTFVLLDGSRVHIDPLFHKTDYFYEIKHKNTKKEKSCSDFQLVGYTCMETDRILTLHDQPLVEEDDCVIFEKVGAYTIGLSPLFISFFPAVYMLTRAGEITLLRPKWTVKEFMQLSSI